VSQSTNAPETHRETTVLEARRDAPRPLGETAAPTDDDARALAAKTGLATAATASLGAWRRAAEAAGAAQRALMRREACMFFAWEEAGGGRRREEGGSKKE